MTVKCCLQKKHDGGKKAREREKPARGPAFSRRECIGIVVFELSRACTGLGERSEPLVSRPVHALLSVEENNSKVFVSGWVCCVCLSGGAKRRHSYRQAHAIISISHFVINYKKIEKLKR